MIMFKALLARHMKIYLRDRWAVFFSFLSIVIILGVFMLFLQNTFGGDFATLEGSDYVVHAWIISGVLMVSTVTVPLGFLGSMVNDHETKTINDFYVAPIKRSTIVSSYIVAAIVIGIALTLVNFLLGQLYLFLRFDRLIGLLDALHVLGLIVLSTTLFSTMLFYIISFIKTMNAHGTMSTLVGTLIGFLAGLYVPAGSLGTTTRNVLSVLPTMQMASIFRVPYTRKAFNEAFAGTPDEFREGWESVLGVTLEFSDNVVSQWVVYVMIIGWIVLFTTLSFVRLNTYKRR